jgi:hypothetical protein
MRSALLLLFSVLASLNASAEVPGRPILSKVTSGGNAPPEIASRRECWILEDRVVIRHSSGDATLVRESPIQLGGKIMAMLKEAAEAGVASGLNQDEEASDKPATVWKGYLRGQFGELKREVPLKGAGSENFYNKARVSGALTSILDQNCY